MDSILCDHGHPVCAVAMLVGCLCKVCCAVQAWLDTGGCKLYISCADTNEQCPIVLRQDLALACVAAALEERVVVASAQLAQAFPQSVQRMREADIGNVYVLRLHGLPVEVKLALGKALIGTFQNAGHRFVMSGGMYFV